MDLPIPLITQCMKESKVRQTRPNAALQYCGNLSTKSASLFPSLLPASSADLALLPCPNPLVNLKLSGRNWTVDTPAAPGTIIFGADIAHAAPGSRGASRVLPSAPWPSLHADSILTRSRPSLLARRFAASPRSSLPPTARCPTGRCARPPCPLSPSRWHTIANDEARRLPFAYLRPRSAARTPASSASPASTRWSCTTCTTTRRRRDTRPSRSSSTATACPRANSSACLLPLSFAPAGSRPSLTHRHCRACSRLPLAAGRSLRSRSRASRPRASASRLGSASPSPTSSAVRRSSRLFSPPSRRLTPRPRSRLAGKRHKTRLFASKEDSHMCDRNGNLPAGTVVEWVSVFPPRTLPLQPGRLILAAVPSALAAARSRRRSCSTSTSRRTAASSGRPRCALCAPLLRSQPARARR